MIKILAKGNFHLKSIKPPKINLPKSFVVAVISSIAKLNTQLMEKIDILQ